MIQRGTRDFVIDLHSCELMDSTFMGTMAGIALRLREIGSGGLSVIRANDRNQQLLENLGLDHLFSFDLPEGEDGIPRLNQTDQAPLETEPPGPEDQKDTILSAHEALVEADPTNEQRFRDVLDLLKHERDRDSEDS